MRTTKRFTPKVLERFRRLGRGQGTFQDYLPWHRVGRGDPSSLGRSHLQMWGGRLRELLSDLEWIGVFFSILLRNLIDLREQFPLSLEESVHELSGYRADIPRSSLPGTLELARRLSIKHPRVNGKGISSEWVMTTDLLLTLRGADGKRELLAIAFKPAEYLAKKRTTDLLRIEEAYWAVRGVKWLLITPKQYDERVALTLRNSMPWALGNAVSESDLLIAITILNQHYGCSLTHLLAQLSVKFGCIDRSQRAFWQAVWLGMITMDLRRGWRPHDPIVILNEDEFRSLNPIASRRSAWI